mmetsp:Transcript_7832/g.10584  ORF Transcript_7832/g.10584 Transcript_7832/m.10584 type:complete len:228 (+) Transcript_7832:196-879(+)|eukprot:CAMPEP_0196574752 /NCGR_PEP_ID=MMETSP1081-20130531/4400_1 /TAXON_ID=36882 /ORGANISM="Pyramimonas amylifera, Strain CCMP720" /LENGTH=227 /DNA_ID=CAMNT_0041892861 /DNA_START=144 /DNA_END=827 /DNA_ORIENTATION=-
MAMVTVTLAAWECEPEELLTPDDQKLIDRVKELDTDNEHWELKLHCPHTQFKVFFYKLPSSPLVMVKGSCNVRASLRELMNFLAPAQEEYLRTLKVTDPTVKCGRVLEAPDPKHRVIFAQVQTPPFVRDREILMQYISTKLGEKSAFVGGYSIEYPGVVVAKNHVRCDVMLSGYLIEEKELGNCDVTLVLHSDPKGFLPKKIVNMIATENVSGLKRIQAHFLDLARK